MKKYPAKWLQVTYGIIALVFEIVAFPFKILFDILDIAETISK